MKHILLTALTLYALALQSSASCLSDGKYVELFKDTLHNELQSSPYPKSYYSKEYKIIQDLNFILSKSKSHQNLFSVFLHTLCVCRKTQLQPGLTCEIYTDCEYDDYVHYCMRIDLRKLCHLSLFLDKNLPTVLEQERIQKEQLTRRRIALGIGSGVVATAVGVSVLQSCSIQ